MEIFGKMILVDITFEIVDGVEMVVHRASKMQGNTSGVSYYFIDDKQYHSVRIFKDEKAFRYWHSEAPLFGEFDADITWKSPRNQF